MDKEINIKNITLDYCLLCYTIFYYIRNFILPKKQFLSRSKDNKSFTPIDARTKNINFSGMDIFLPQTF